MVAQPKAITVEGNGSNAPEGKHRPEGGPSLGCDQPLGQSKVIVHNELRLSGWATSPHGISGVVVQIGDRTLNATYGLDTPWIAESTPEVVGADRAGFELKVDTSSWPAGEQEAKVVAFDGKGGRAEAAGEVRILPFDEPRHTEAEIPSAIADGEVVMWLENPPVVESSCEVEGPVTVRGWAYAKDGLEAVRVLVDGRDFDALHPIVRPDLLDTLGPDVAGNAGFVLPLDPSELPPGPHELTVVAVGREGRGVGVSGGVVVLPEPPQERPQPGSAAAIEWIEEREEPARWRDPAERYDPEAGEGSALELEHRLRYRWALELAQGRTVLDAGCGAGWGAALIAEAGAERVVAIDDEEARIADAQRRNEGLVIEYHCCDPCLLPFEDDSFDLITCFEAIERSEDPDLALKELRRVLSPEGVLLTSAVRPPIASGGDRGAWAHTGGELELALRRDFENVRAHRQSLSLTSAILAEGAAGDAIEVDASETPSHGGARSGAEARVVMIASNGPLPAPRSVAALGSPATIHRLHDGARTWEDRALRAEAEVAATRVQLNLARMHQEASARLLRKRTAEAASLETARERLEEQEGRVVEQQVRLEEQEVRLNEQQARLEEQEVRLREQQARLEQQDARIWEQHEQIEDRRKEVEEQRELTKKQEGRVVEQQARLEEQEVRLNEQQARLEQQDAGIWEQHEQIEAQQDQIAEHLGRIERQRGDIEEQRKEIEGQRGEVEAQREQVSQRDVLIDSQAGTLGARNAELRVTAECLRRAEAEADSLRTSASVRITRPLRAVGNGFRRVRLSLGFKKS